MAERLGGMTAFEVMERMTMEEMLMWEAYDNIHISKHDYQFAAMMCQIEWHKGVPHPDMKRYLPKIKGRPRRRKTFAELKSQFDTAVAASGRARNGG
jgi:hypothetical protein